MSQPLVSGKSARSLNFGLADENSLSILLLGTRALSGQLDAVFHCGSKSNRILASTSNQLFERCPSQTLKFV